MFDGGAIALRFLYPDSTTLVDYMELELPDCMSMQNMSHNYQYHVTPAPSSSRRTDTAMQTVRLVPHLPGRWSSDQRVLWLYPRIRCAAYALSVCGTARSYHTVCSRLRAAVPSRRVKSSVFVRYGQRLTPPPQTTGKSWCGPRTTRALCSSASSGSDFDWRLQRIDVVAAPVALAKPPKRLAPSLTWAPVDFFAPNSTAAGIAHSIAMFRAVGTSSNPPQSAS